jgi:hypothetical protein
VIGPPSVARIIAIAGIADMPRISSSVENVIHVVFGVE